jgi:hypothetical protein
MDPKVLMSDNLTRHISVKMHTVLLNNSQTAYLVHK